MSDIIGRIEASSGVYWPILNHIKHNFESLHDIHEDDVTKIKTIVMKLLIQIKIIFP